MATNYVLLLGKDGNVSQSFQSLMAADSRFKYSALSYLELKKLVEENMLEEYFSNITKSYPQLNFWVVYCCGITSPNAPSMNLRAANIDLPMRVLTAILGSNARLVTFGTIMENYITICENNPYLHSKLLFSQGLSTINRSSYLHIRLHTLYGGMKLQSHMFLGQLYNSLKSQKDFIMSRGEQKREYHHIDDDVSICLRLILLEKSGIVEINSGQPIRLIDLANAVYDFFLPIGRVLPILESPQFEIFEMNFKPMSSFDAKPVVFRDPIDGVIDYFREKPIY